MRAGGISPAPHGSRRRFSSWIARWVIGARHYTDASPEASRFMTYLGPILLNVAILWMVYVALEPFVRRVRPTILISWTRLLAGRIRDSRVGRDVLVGLAVGAPIALLGLGFGFVPELLGNPPAFPRGTGVEFSAGGRGVLASYLRMLPNSLQNAMMISFVFVVSHVAFRKSWAAVIVTSVVFGVFVVEESGGDFPLATVLFGALFVVPLVLTLFAFGLVALATAFFANQAIASSPLTLDLAKPYAAVSAWVMVAVLALALPAFYASRGGKPLLGNILPKE